MLNDLQSMLHNNQIKILHIKEEIWTLERSQVKMVQKLPVRNIVVKILIWKDKAVYIRWPYEKIATHKQYDCNRPQTLRGKFKLYDKYMK